MFPLINKSNPSVNPKSLTIREIFIYSKRPNTLFGIDGYDVPKKYCDPIKIMKEREFLTQKKGRKLKGKIPNKYFEQKPKISPAPNTYSIIKPWADVKEKKSKSFMHKTKNVSKHTYIDQIFDEGKRIKSPGPGSYEPYEHKIIVRLKQKLSKEEKPSFLSESEYVGVTIPGPGYYNPRKEIKRIHLNPTKSQWVAKNRAKTGEKFKSPYPDQGTYNPIPIDRSTFAKIFKENGGKIKPTGAKSKYFGSVDRFGQNKKNKSKRYSVPGPGFYNILYDWQGKPEKQRGKSSEKKINLSSIISKGIDKSLYYD